MMVFGGRVGFDGKATGFMNFAFEAIYAIQPVIVCHQARSMANFRV